MPGCLAFGNNVCGNLDPTTAEAILTTGTPVTALSQCRGILWSNWSATIGEFGDIPQMQICTWGVDELAGEDFKLTPLTFKSPPKKILGVNFPVGYLGSDGHVYTFQHQRSTRTWNDLVVTGLGSAFGINENGIFRFDTLADLVSSTSPIPISHPLIPRANTCSLHATESRVLLLCPGSLVHLFELHETPTKRQEVTVLLLEDLEGLGVKEVIPGSANRFGVITDAGDAYLIAKGSRTAELLQLPDDGSVRLLGVGSKHEVVVTTDSVWVRGDNTFGQLGCSFGDEESMKETFMKHPSFGAQGIVTSSIKQMRTSRWSTVMVVGDNVAA